MDYDDFEEKMDDELDPEKLKKARAIHDKLDALMGEAAELFLEPETIEKIKNKVVRVMERRSLTPNINNLRVMLVGVQFGIASASSLGNDAMSIAVGIRHMIEDKEKALPKLDIDITKSKPLQ